VKDVPGQRPSEAWKRDRERRRYPKLGHTYERKVGKKRGVWKKGLQNVAGALKIKRGNSDKKGVVRETQGED